MRHSKITLVPIAITLIILFITLLSGCISSQSEFYLKNGDKHMNNDSYAKALGAYKRANNTITSDVSLLRIAAAQINMSQFQEAQETINSIKTDSAKSHYLLAIIYFNLADPVNGQTAIEKSLQYDPVNVQTLSLYGEILIANGNYQRSTEIYNQALVLCSGCDTRSELLHNQTMALIYSGQMNRAKETFNVYLQNQRHITSADHKLAGAIAWGSGDHNLALSHWKDLNQTDKARIIAAIDSTNDIYEQLAQAKY